MNSTTPKAKKVKQKLIQVQRKGVGGRRVADQRLKGLILGPGPGEPGPPRYRGKRREHQKIRRLFR